VGKETVRRVLMEPGKLARTPASRGYFGKLVQIDSSYHQWSTGDETYYWLLNIIDDATSRFFCRFVGSDSYRTIMAVFKSYIEAHGRLQGGLHGPGVPLLRQHPQGRREEEGHHPGGEGHE
jgi:hypothetical protein